MINEALFRPFRYCYRTWSDGEIVFRNKLIETTRRWHSLGFTGYCHVPELTPRKLAAHQKQFQRFLAAHELRNNLSSLLNTASDGWVPSKDWETVKKAHKELFDGMLEAVLRNEAPDDDKPIRSEADLRAIWPFDLE